jgi:hypothetical protein
MDKCWKNYTVYAGVLFYIPQVATPNLYLYNAFGNVFYMPTIALNNSISYNALKLNMDVIKIFHQLGFENNRFYCSDVDHKSNGIKRWISILYAGLARFTRNLFFHITQM